jgi:hypothetical protein
MQIEIWKDIIGFEGHYQVSNLGRIKSLERILTTKIGRRLTVKEKILKIFLSRQSYQLICLALNDEKFPKQVHTIVAEAFLIKKPNSEVNHIDGNRLNNHVSNLEYVTHLENINHRERSNKNQERYGITLEKKKNLWLAQISINGKPKKIGRSKCKEKAYQRFYEAYLSLHGVTPW